MHPLADADAEDALRLVDPSDRGVAAVVGNGVVVVWPASAAQPSTVKPPLAAMAEGRPWQ